MFPKGGRSVVISQYFMKEPMENQTILGRVLLQLLKIVVTSRLDQLVLLNIYLLLVAIQQISQSFAQ